MDIAYWIVLILGTWVLCVVGIVVFIWAATRGRDKR